LILAKDKAVSISNSADNTMQRYKLTLSYDGTNYCGWQRQPKVEQIAVEQRLEEVLSQIYGMEIDVFGQGRTDAGVHALAQTAHVDLPPKMSEIQLLRALNSLLRKDICIVQVEPVSSDFHARFDAKSRSYVYKLTTKPNPLHRNFVLSQFRNFDLNLMQQASSIFVGEHDFTSFSIQASLLPHARCTVLAIGFFQENEEGVIRFTIKANRFLRRMVRRVVGSLLMVGLGRLSVAELHDLLDNPREADPRVYTVSAHGLALVEVEY
jgi:tRNA pseudouridine38-40 synthase